MVILVYLYATFQRFRHLNSRKTKIPLLTLPMKKLFLILVALALVFGCVPDDNENRTNFHMEFLPVTAVDLPQTMSRGETYTIKVNFNLPTDCHYFNGFYYNRSNNTRTVAVQALVIEDNNCTSPADSNVGEQKSFEFYCTPDYSYNYYIFKFYQGVNEETNQDEFLEIQVPVTQ